MAVVALLGPTNTGKTFRAIERMLELESGMMGLPLRLLAREVYDKVSTRVGEGAVALVTGEEKRIPARPRYWIATVEAMPVGRPVEFVAVDEIQLAAHAERGHVFTNRLLHARGTVETWFLGAATMRDVVTRLVPGVEIRSSPRLSKLAWSGATRMGQIPKRSAVVAFSMPRVFELAERLRERKGGAAVVLGAMSPRARNAQVAMFQSGEVDYVVATDAIGMGPNLSIDHVAFADLRKFDGKEERALDLSELGQIAGRAGRYTRDGMFGVLAPEAPLPASAVRALETHRFPPVEVLRWRNADLDLSTVGSLLASLEERPPDASMRRTDDADDHRALRALLGRADIAERARARPDARLLWQVAQIPDYRKLLFEDHVETLARLFAELDDSGGVVDRVGVEEELDRIAQPALDVEELLARLARVRIWNYVANLDWIDPRSGVRERAIELEDALSDRLQIALRNRFVGAPRAARSSPGVAGHPFAALAERLGLQAGAPVVPERSFLERVASADHADLELLADATIRFDGVVAGQATGGRSIAEPSVRVVAAGSPSDRLRAERRLVAFTRDALREIVDDVLPPIAELSVAGRGVHFALSRGLTTALAGPAKAQIDELTDRDRELLREAGVILGEVALYHAAQLKPAAVAKRTAFVRAIVGPGPRLPSGAEISVRRVERVDARVYLALGYPVIGERPVRADIVERVARRIRESTDAPESLPVASWLSMSPRDALSFVRALAA